VLPFAGLEVIVLAAAFVACGRHAADYERIELAGGRLTVEVADADRTERHEIEARAARLSVEPHGQGARVLLRSPARELEVGRHLDAAARVELAAELVKRLRL
jgi:uncharacterized membrane protein